MNPATGTGVFYRAWVERGELLIERKDKRRTEVRSLDMSAECLAALFDMASYDWSVSKEQS